jgi:hypothetical protein
VPFGEQQLDAMVNHHTLLHREPLLVVSANHGIQNKDIFETMVRVRRTYYR